MYKWVYIGSEHPTLQPNYVMKNAKVVLIRGSNIERCEKGKFCLRSATLCATAYEPYNTQRPSYVSLFYFTEKANINLRYSKVVILSMYFTVNQYFEIKISIAIPTYLELQVRTQPTGPNKVRKWILN